MVNNMARLCLGLLVCIVLAACKPSSPQDKADDRSGAPLNHNFTLSQTEFDALSAEDQFMVANKVLSTMYRGIPADEFFDLTQGLDKPVVQYTNFINRTQSALQQDLSSSELESAEEDIFGVADNPATPDVDEYIPARFTSFDSDSPHQIYIARALGYPVSRDQFVEWMSVFLANTIMFSPAREMESTDEADISRVLDYLKTAISDNTPIRSIIKGWLGNLSRWRVSRSPENHALEMFELYLGVFNDTPEEQQNTINGGIACSKYYLTDASRGYELQPDNMFTGLKKPVKVFNQYVYDCKGLYDVVAGHPLLIPRVVEVIANYFLDGMSAAKKLSVVKEIVGTNPQTFEDIFLAVMFSKAFLLESERPKSFEENAFNFLYAMHWTPRSDSGELDQALTWRMYSYRDWNRNGIKLSNMGWSSMDYKIGRTPFLPMDVLVFAFYHKAIREEVLLNGKAFDGSRYPKLADFTESETPRDAPFEIVDGAFYIAGTEDLKPQLESLTVPDFIDYVFLSALGRRATADETKAFVGEGIARDHLRYYEDDTSGEERLSLRRTIRGDDELHEIWTDDFAEVMLDYISRLPEFYYYKAVQ